MTGTYMVHIPYKGSAPALADLMAGRVHLMFDNLASALPHIQAGKVRALAVTTRGSQLVPAAAADAGRIRPEGLRLTTWWGVMAPAQTPQAVVVRLFAEIRAAMEAPDVKERLRAMGSETPAACASPSRVHRLRANASGRSTPSW